MRNGRASATCRTAATLAIALATSAGLMASPATKDVCGELDPALAPVLSKADVLLLGEVHGSREIPRYTLSAVCTALDQSRPVVLGLEIPTSEQKRVDTYLGSNGDEMARTQLLAGDFWQRSYQDGRSSEAMAELIEGARQLVAAGKPLRVLCFDAPVQEGENRDGAMGRYLVAHRQAHPTTRLVVLTGNIHARTTVGTPWDPDLKPTGYYLAATDETVVSLKARNAAGEFWVCNPDCGRKRLGGRGTAEARGVVLFDEPDPRGNDGLFDVGTPTASPPAVRK